MQFQSAAANEGTWVRQYLADNLGGDPDEVPVAYRTYSIYSYDVRDQLDLQFLHSTHVRAYTEPLVNWWIDTRRKDYYDMNSIDLAGLINELKIRGHPNAELIITDKKGYRPDGSQRPHSWSIVDERELIDWFIGILK